MFDRSREVAAGRVADASVETRSAGTTAGERRHGTILAADLSDSTRLLRDLGDERGGAFIEACLAVLEATARKWGGEVLGRFGDGVYVGFGATRAIEGSTRHALNAAIEMRRRLREPAPEDGRDRAVELHVGVHSGPLIVRAAAERLQPRPAVTGDSIALSLELRSLAPPGAIYVGPTVAARARREFEFRALPEFEADERRRICVAYELVSGREQSPRSERTPSLRLVGRSREIELIRRAADRVAAGTGAVVSVVGDAGIGKSCLVEEAKRSALGEFELLEARSLAIAQTEPFQAFVDLLSRWAGIADHRDPEAAASALLDALARRLPAQAEEVFPFLARMAGLPVEGASAARVASLDPEASLRFIQLSLRELLLALAHDGPVAIVFDDLHWADSSSLELLESCIALVERAPILFVLVLRGDARYPAQDLLERTGRSLGERYLPIDLAPLDSPSSAQLLSTLLGGAPVPSSLRSTMLARAAGNPFFLEELARARLESANGEVDEIATPAIALPEAIGEVILARVDRLPETSRRVLQIASVIGYEIPRELLVHTAEMPHDLEPALAALLNAQLLLGDAALAQPVYRFRHAIVQETVYESTLKARRTVLHHKVAEAIEALFADRLPEFYAMLAYHYGRTDDLERTESYLSRAGERAAAVAASSETLRFFVEASRLYLLRLGERADPARRFALERSIGLALLTKGDLVAAVDHFDRALVYLGRPPARGVGRVFRFVRGLGSVLVDAYVGWPRRVRRPPTAVDQDELAVHRARDRALVSSDSGRYFLEVIDMLRLLARVDPSAIDEAAAMYAGGGILFVYAGISLGLSRRLFETAERLLQADDVKSLIFFRTARFVRDHLAGSWTEDRGLDERLIAIGFRLGLFWDVNTYLGMACERAIYRGDFDRAREHLARLAELNQTYGFDFASSNLLFESTLMHLAQGQLAEAKESLAAYRESRPEALLDMHALAVQAKIHLAEDDLEAAARAIGEAEAMAASLRWIPPYHGSLVRLSRLLLDATMLERAAGARRSETAAPIRAWRASRSARRSLRVARRVARDRPESLRLAGRVAWLRGRQRRAIGLWRKAVVEAERLGARPELARIWREVARRLSEPGSRHPSFQGMAPAELDTRAAALEQALRPEDSDAAHPGKTDRADPPNELALP